MTTRPSIAVQIGSTQVPTGTVIASITVTRGRTDVRQPVEPSTATLQLLRKESPPEAAFTLGSSVRIEARAAFFSVNTAFISLFLGRITTVAISEELVTITATSSQLGALAQARGSVTVSAGSVHSAMATVAAACPVTVDTSTTSSTSVIAQTLTGGTYLDYLRSVGANDPGSLLYEGNVNISSTPVVSEPRVVWESGSDRRSNFRPGSSTVTYTINPEAIVDTWEMSKDLGQLVNRCTVTYGSPAATVTASDASSIATYGTYDTALTTTLSSSADATLLARRTVTFGTNPGWSASLLTVDLANWSASLAQLGSFLGNPLDRLAKLTTRPTTRLPEVTVIEGITHRITRTTWMMDLALSDPELSRLPQRWSDIQYGLNPTLKWSGVAAGWDWNDSIKKDL